MTIDNDTPTSKSTIELDHDTPAPTNQSPHFKTTSIPTHSVSKVVPFVVTIVISVATAILYTNLHLAKQANQFVAETQQMKQHQQDMKAENTLAFTTMDHDLTQRLTTINQTLESAMHERWYQSNDWIMLKARYYLELASINAHWSNDSPTTSSLLKAADTLLATIPGDRLSSVRQAIAKEHTELLQISPIDTTGILSQLDAIQHVINTLIPKKPLTVLATSNTPPNENSSPRSWREHLKESIQKLNSLIIIRHQDDTLTPLLTPAYVTLLSESIRLNLQEAQWSVLQKNQTIYQLSLSQAIENVDRVFDKSQTTAIITQLTTLRSIQLVQPKPELGQSLQLLNDAISSSHPSPPPLSLSTQSNEAEKPNEPQDAPQQKETEPQQSITPKPQNSAGASS
ncbi:MAG: uroporphyrinogen-III C-methyltransferase [Legionellaceae bacterium]|nr:uroporphyrinogen-III C-methyltransferase [Legionellaceae bacterium]